MFIRIRFIRSSKRMAAPLIAALLLCATCLALTLTAAGAGAATHPARLVDEAGLLSPDEAARLEALLDQYSEELEFDIVVVTTSDLQGKSPARYADDYFDYKGYGYGSNKNGALFLRYINGSQKEVWISTTGEGIDAISDRDIQDIFDDMEPYIMNDPCLAFEYFAKDVRDEVKDHRSYDTVWIIVGIIAGLITGLVVTSIMRSSLRSVRSQKYAGSYIKDGSLDISVARDIFLYRTISRVPRPRDNGGGGGGSSVHRGSSGTSHGGGGRSM